jgi:protein-export membrane protein SecD
LAFPNLPEWWGKNKLKLGLDLRGGMQILLEVDTSELSETDARGAVDQNIKIIRERLDQFGVAEPSIQKLGDKRIMVQLPGVSNFDAAEKLIKQTAMLEFKLVAQPEDSKKVMEIIDTNINNNLALFPKLAELDKKDRKLLAADSTKADSVKTESGVFSTLVRPGERDYEVQFDSIRMVQDLLADSLFHQAVPMGFQLAFEKANTETTKADRRLVVLHSAVELTGSDLAKAKVDFGSSTSTDPRIANKPYISIEMKRDGAKKFEKVTGDNMNRRLAIVLDGVVYSDPNINDRISGGRAQITGSFTTSEATELAIVLNTGNLVAPIKPISTSIIGATLGSDRVRSGSTAGLIGLLAVVIFMLVYYKLSGFIADFVLVFNVGFILAILTAFGATLTLPGIAGIILTIGMAVDANVLIFERVREELDMGKTPRSAVDAGYKRAVVTVWDANLTTLIAAAVLYNFGSGPIRGFAITLAIGIIGSMFSAIVFVRSILDTFVITGTSKNLSI